MNETDALVRLQEIDLAVMRHKRTLAAMPQAKKLVAVRAARKKIASEMNKIVGRRKDIEMDIVDNEKSSARLEEVVGEVQARYHDGSTGYRELADIEAQLSSLAKQMEKRSFQHGELLKALEAVRAEEQRALDLDHRLVSEAETLLDSYRGQTASIEEELRQLGAERDSIVAALSEETYAKYVEASKRFGGLAVETLAGNRPSICRVAISPSSYGDIRRGPSITECPYCHRMLVTEGMFDIDNK